MKFHSSRKIGQELHKLLKAGKLLPIMEFIEKVPAKKLITPLIRAFYKEDSLERWLAIKAFGKVVSKIADKNLEEARIIIRRLMWSLNDESGGIGWGAPEAMAEAMVNNRSLAKEYSRILLSYIWKDGNYLEYLPLRRGALWGLYIFAKKQPDIFEEINAKKLIKDYLFDSDPASKALAMLALGYTGDKKFCDDIASNLSDRRVVKLFLEDKEERLSVSDVAAMSLKKLNC